MRVPEVIYNTSNMSTRDLTDMYALSPVVPFTTNTPNYICTQFNSQA